MSDVESDGEAWPEAVVIVTGQPLASPNTLSKEPAAKSAPASLPAASQAPQIPTAPNGMSALSPAQTAMRTTSAETPCPTSCATTSKPTGSARRAPSTSPAQTGGPVMQASAVATTLSPAQTPVTGLQAITGVTPAKKADSAETLHIVNTPKQGLLHGSFEVGCQTLPYRKLVPCAVQSDCKPACRLVITLKCIPKRTATSLL